MTTALLWLPLVLHHAHLLWKDGHFWSSMGLRMVPTALAVLVTATLIDTWFYRALGLVHSTEGKIFMFFVTPPHLSKGFSDLMEHKNGCNFLAPFLTALNIVQEAMVDKGVVRIES